MLPSIDSTSYSSLYRLFRNIYGVISCTSSYIELRLIDPKTNRVSRKFFPTKKWREALTFGVSITSKNVYIGIAARQDMSSGRRENCSALTALWCDIDDPGNLMGGGWPKEIPQPSQIWASGGITRGMPKMHCYWFLEKPISRDRFNLAESIMRGIASIMNGDRNCTDVSRCLRMPGTLNLKYRPPQRSSCIADLKTVHSFSKFIDLAKHDPVALERQMWEARRKERQLAKQRYQSTRNPLVLEDPIGVMCHYCSLMSDCRETGGDLPEPLWFAALSNLAAFASYGADPHAFSSGHAKYRFNETEQKWRRVLEGVERFGPVGCAKIAANGGCRGCKYHGVVRAPAGIPYKEAAEEARRRARERAIRGGGRVAGNRRGY